MGDQNDARSQSQKKLWSGSFVAITIINFFNFFSFNILTSGMPIYISSLGGSTVEIGLVVTLCTATAIIVRPFTGILLDRFGRRGILLSSMVYTTIIVAAYAVFPVVGLLLALRLFHGIGWGFSGTATSTVASDLLPKSRFAEGMGYFAMANSVAVAIAPALAIVLLDNFGATPMIAVSCVSLVIACILAFAVRFPRIELNETKKGIPKLSDLFERTALLPGILIVLVNMSFATLITFIAVYGQERGVEAVSLYFVAYAITTIISRPIIGRIIDRVGFFVPGIIACLCSTATLLFVSVSSNTVMFVCAGVLAGLGIGTAMSVFQTMAVSSVSPDRRGVANSTYFFFFDLGICVGSLVAGAIAGVCGYSMTFAVMAVPPVIACIAIVVYGRKRINGYHVNLSAAENADAR